MSKSLDTDSSPPQDKAYRRSTNPDSINMSINRNRKITIRDHKQYEIDLMNRIIADTGKWAYGLIGIGLWVFCKEKEKICLADGGQWIEYSLHDPWHHHNAKEEMPHEDCLVCVMENPLNKNFLPPPDYAPGVGIPGVLWGETESGLKSKKDEHHQSKLKSVEWRDVNALAADPDQPYDERIQQLVKIGVGWAGAVPFSINGHIGIIIFYARSTVNLVALESDANTEYLLASADFIGSAYALRQSRMAAIEEREKRLKRNIRRIRTKLMVLVCMGKTLEEIRDQRAYEETLRAAGADSTNNTNRIIGSLHNTTRRVGEKGKQVADKTKEHTKRAKGFAERKIKTTLKKCMGANVKAPKAFTWEASAYSFVGVTLTVWCIFQLRYHLKDKYGVEWSIVTLGPLMSATVSVYVLTAAPASQPRNTFMAHLIAMIIGICLSYTKGGLPVWVRQGFAVGLYAFCTTKFGFIHAPASGLAMAFSEGNNRWSNFMAQLAAIVIICTIGSVYNNLHPKRQYPTAWGFRKFNSAVGGWWNKAMNKVVKHSNEEIMQSDILSAGTSSFDTAAMESAKKKKEESSEEEP